MARKTFASFNLAGNERGIWQSIATALATLASGKNPDTTDYTLPVDQGLVTATKAGGTTADNQAVVATTNLRLLGFSARESAGSAAVATFKIYAGTSNAGTLLAVVELAADASIQHTFPGGGLNAAAGIFIERIAGTTEIVVHTIVKA